MPYYIHIYTCLLDHCQGREVEQFCRTVVDVAPKTCAYVPDKLTDDEMAQNTLKRAIFGAAFLDHMDKLPKNDSFGVIWEVQTCLDPPAHMRVIKPKFWLLGAVRMKANMAYKLG
jgi:hypothetical protein